MHRGRTALRGSVLALCTAGAVALGAGSASANQLTPALRGSVVSSNQVYRADWDYCDDWNHRDDEHCRGDRWTWDEDHHHWVHDRWDGHQWNRR